MMPDKIGRFELRGVLGRGAMGTVLDGWDPVIGRRVAIKTVRLADAAADEEAAESLERFKREAQAAGRLTHANIVGVFDSGETDEVAYIVMEFVEGQSLKELLDTEKSLSAGDATEIMGQVLAGLEYSHKRGVVHRDIKPANIMLTTEGDVKISDFGIARIASSTATAVGSILGTPAYMPPEQFLGEPADARSDIYAAGAMLFHLLTGSRPFEGNATSIMTKALNAEAPPRPSERSVSVAPAWDSVIRRAMAKKPEDRFQTAAEFAQAVKAAAAAPVVAETGPVAADEADATMVVAAPRASAARVLEPVSAVMAPSAPAVKKSGLSPVILGGGVLAVVVAGGAATWLLLSPGQKAPEKIAAPPTVTPVPPAAPVISKPAPPPQPEAPKPPSPEDVQANLATGVAALPCSFVQSELEDGRLKLQGIAGGQAKDALDQLVATAGLPVTQDVQMFAGPYCPALDVLAPLLRSDRLHFSATDKPGPVSADQHFHPTVKDVPFGGWVEVDYLSGDGTVFHALPMAASKSPKMVAEAPVFLQAGATLRLGDPPHNGLIPGTPYGKDMFVAIVSSQKLFTGLRPQGESISDYAGALTSAIEKVRAAGGKVAAGVVLVKTVEK